MLFYFIGYQHISSISSYSVLDRRDCELFNFIFGTLNINLKIHSMIRVQTKISQGLEVLQFFTMRNWIFKSEKFQGIVREQSPDEYKMFFIDTASVPDNFEDQFLKNTFLGGRLYLLKEPHSTIPRARIQMKM